VGREKKAQWPNNQRDGVMGGWKDGHIHSLEGTARVTGGKIDFGKRRGGEPGSLP